MTCASAERPGVPARTALVVLLALAAPVLRPGALQAQGHGRRLELGVQGTAAASDPALAVVGVYGGLRPSPRLRLAAQLGAGAIDTDPTEATWRGELAAHFLLNPSALHHAGLYGGGGVAVSGAHGAETHGWAMLTLGLEGRPGGPNGWALELGVGGGVRVSAGWRWRWAK
jgi:hypothetical protein